MSKTNQAQPTPPTTVSTPISNKPHIYGKADGPYTFEAEEIKGNVIAVKQLINDCNRAREDKETMEERYHRIESELEYLKVSPYIAIFSLGLNVTGSAIVAIATNMLTSVKADHTLDWTLLVAGGLVVLAASAMPLFYPRARAFFNRT